MKVLVVHNRYQRPGGEDAVVDDEMRLLASRGHDVRLYERSNHEIERQPRWLSAAQTLWSERSRQEVGALIDDWRPDVLHVHNTFALVSPAVLWAARRRGIAVVASLHNYRLACLEGTFLRDGRICEQCLGRVPWRGVILGCCRGSRTQSAVLAGSIVLHRALGSWQRHVHRFIVLSRDAKQRLQQTDIAPDRLHVRANFAWPAPDRTDTSPRRGGLYVGRLSPEKGIEVLADALTRSVPLPFAVIGDGPQRERLAASPAVQLGALAPEAVTRRMVDAAWLVIPSLTLELPRVLSEAYAAGLPVIASRHGPLADWVKEGETGWLFEPGNAAELADRMVWAHAHPEQTREMGERARQLHALRLSPQAAYDSLMQVYGQARALAESSATSTSS